MRLFLSWLGVLAVVVITITLTYFIVVPTVMSGLSLEVQVLLTAISGIVAFLAAVAQITGYDLRTILQLRSRGRLGDAKHEATNSTIPDQPKYQTSHQFGLPPKPFSRLVGRERWISELMGILRDPAGPAMLSITGLGGIGKTALAYELADRSLREHLFVGVVWFSAKQQVIVGRRIKDVGKGPSTYSEVLEYIQRRLLSGTSDVPRHNRDAQLRHLLKSRPHLLVVDNLEMLRDEVLLVESLPSLLHPSRAILTGRSKLEKLDHVHTAVIGGLEEPYSIELIRQEANDRGVSALANAEYQILHRIHNETGGMPLAIKLVVSEVLTGLAIETVLERLRHATDEEELYRFIYFDLWNTLTDPAQQVLVAMSAFASSVNREMLQQVSEVSGTEFDAAIMELVQKSLLDASEDVAIKQRRYSIHALTRNFINCDLPDIFEDQKRRH